MARAAYKPPEVSPRIERERKEKAEKRSLIDSQVRDGSLTIRPMTASERQRWGLPPLPSQTLTVDEVARLWRLRAAGETRIQIASALNCHVNTVRNAISRRGVYKGSEYDPA